jgi:hypothetical protein
VVLPGPEKLADGISEMHSQYGVPYSFGMTSLDIWKNVLEES